MLPYIFQVSESLLTDMEMLLDTAQFPHHSHAKQKNIEQGGSCMGKFGKQMIWGGNPPGISSPMFKAAGVLQI